MGVRILQNLTESLIYFRDIYCIRTLILFNLTNIINIETTVWKTQFRNKSGASVIFVISKLAQSAAFNSSHDALHLREFLSKYLKLFPLRKHAYSNILRILPPKNENFQMKNSDIFLISAQNIDCRYSSEPPR